MDRDYLPGEDIPGFERLTFPKPQDLGHRDAGQVHAWLTDQGVTVDGVTISDDGSIEVIVPAAAVPKGLDTIIAAYRHEPTADEQERQTIIADAIQALAEIMDTPRGQRTTAEKLHLGVMALVAPHEIRNAQSSRENQTERRTP